MDPNAQPQPQVSEKAQLIDQIMQMLQQLQQMISAEEAQEGAPGMLPSGFAQMLMQQGQ